MSNELDKCLMDLYSRNCPKNFEYLNIIRQLNISLDKFKIVHVGGTNGKGSVSYKIANCLKSCGCNVGLFTSPHIWTPCERISINNQIISNENFIRYYKIVSNVDNSRQLRIFEVFMIMAFMYFIDNDVEWVVLEVGIGGRLDSTNFITSSKLVVITSIGLDHMNILGENLSDIAYEKAGIIKPNTTVVIGPSCVKYAVFKDKCKENHCKLIPVTINALEFDTENTEIAKIALTQGLGLDSKIVNQRLTIKPPLRYYHLSDYEKQIIGLSTYDEVIIDVAHNLPGMYYLAKQFSAQKYRNLLKICIYFNSEGRSLDVLAPLALDFYDIYLASVDHPRISNNTRLLRKLNEMHETQLKIKLMKSLSKTNGYFIHNTPNYKEIINYALGEIKKTSGVLLLCGSFFAMFDICSTFQILPSVFGISNQLPSVKY